MDKSIRYHPQFKLEIIEAKEWYNVSLSGLGSKFQESVRVAIDSILSDPERFAIDSFGDRYQQINRFPYIIVFDVTEVEIQFLGIYHTSRLRGNLKNRKSEM